MGSSFNLKWLIGIVTVVTLFLVVAKNETLWLASASLFCLFGWMTVGKLSNFFVGKISNLLSTSYSTGQLWRLSRIFRLLPWLAVIGTFLVILIPLTNSVREESIAVSGTIATWAWLAAPVGYFISFNGPSAEAPIKKEDSETRSTASTNGSEHVDDTA